MCSDLSPLKEDGHSDDSGLLMECRVSSSVLPSQPLDSQNSFLASNRTTQNIFPDRILTAKS